MREVTVRSLSLEKRNGNVFIATHSQDELLNDVNVMYLGCLRKFKQNLFIPPFNVCNEKKCQWIKERLEEHKHKYHQTSSSKHVSKKFKPLSRDHSVQTFSKDVKSDTGTLYEDIAQENRDHINDIKNEVMTNGQIDELITLKRTQSCNTTISFKNLYKDRLLSEILQWLREIPIESEFDTNAKLVTERTINHLIERINRLSLEAATDRYDAKLKREIKRCLNALPLTYHSSKCDKLKCMLTENLISRIMLLNSKYIQQFSNSSVRGKSFNRKCFGTREFFGDVDDAALFNSFKEQITSWLESKRLFAEDGTSVNAKHVAMMLLNRLLPLLKDKKLNNSKYLVKGVIVEALDAMDLTYVTLDLNKNRVYLNSLANELLKIVLNAKKNYVPTKYSSYTGFAKTFKLNLRNMLHFSSKHKSVQSSGNRAACKRCSSKCSRTNPKFNDNDDSVSGSRDTNVNFFRCERGQYVNMNSATLLGSLTSPDDSLPAGLASPRVGLRHRRRLHACCIAIFSWA